MGHKESNQTNKQTVSIKLSICHISHVVDRGIKIYLSGCMLTIAIFHPSLFCRGHLSLDLLEVSVRNLSHLEGY